MSESNNQTTTSEAIESLRYILGQELSREVAYEEALEVGESLLDFYELLGMEGETDE